jgi:hypothetical protein
MEKFIRVLVAIVLVAILLSELGSCAFNMFGPQDDDVVSTVGEVVLVEPRWMGYLDDEERQRWACYYIYVRPVGKGNNEELLLFTANCDTEMTSEFGADRSKIPELQVGSVVEITHTHKMLRYSDMHPDDDRRTYLRGYEALSISIYEGEYKGRQTVLQKNPDFWWGEDMNYSSGYYGSPDQFTVSYVARVTYPMRGYLVYGYREETTFRSEEVIWIGVGVFLDSKTRQALESDATGYTLWISTEYVRPFNNSDAVQCTRAKVGEYDDLYGNEYEESDYVVYRIDEFVGTKNILVKPGRYEKYDRYYYFKLDGGEVKALYKNDDKDYYRDLCTASAEGGPVSGMFPEGGFPDEIYISLESLGDRPVSGELVISFVPLDETDYFNK